MAWEIVSVTTLLLSGILILKYYGLRNWGLLPFGLIAGAVLFTLIVYAQLAFGFIADPSTSLFATLLVSSLIYLIGIKSKLYELNINLKYCTVVVLSLSLIVSLLYISGLARYHSDSLHFLMIGSLLADKELSAINGYSVQTRLSALPVIHSLGALSGNFYLRSITPLFSLSIIFSYIWFLREYFKKTLMTNYRLVWFAAIGSLLLLTNHAYIFHSFYLNGHLMTAAYFIVATSSGLLLSRGTTSAEKKLFTAMLCISIAGLVFTRVEGFLYAGIALIPALFSSDVLTKNKRLLLAIFGLSIALQQAIKFQFSSVLNDSALNEIALLFAFGSVVFILAMISRREIFEKISVKYLYLIELGLWLGLMILFLKSPGILIDSIRATIQNTLIEVNPWGASIAVLILLFFLTLILKRFKHQIFLRFPLTAFVPVVLILAYIRDNAYRVAYADSLNRMIIQVLPLAVLFIIISIATHESTKLMNKHNK